MGEPQKCVNRGGILLTKLQAAIQSMICSAAYDHTQGAGIQLHQALLVSRRACVIGQDGHSRHPLTGLPKHDPVAVHRRQPSNSGLHLGKCDETEPQPSNLRYHDKLDRQPEVHSSEVAAPTTLASKANSNHGGGICIEKTGSMIWMVVGFGVGGVGIIVLKHGVATPGRYVTQSQAPTHRIPQIANPPQSRS